MQTPGCRAVTPKTCQGTWGGLHCRCGSGYESVLEVIAGVPHGSWGAGRAAQQDQPLGAPAQRLLSRGGGEEALQITSSLSS